MKFAMIVLLFVVCLMVSISVVSCKQEIETDFLQVKRELLTGDTLIYEEEIVNWKYPSERVVFKRESTANVLPLEDMWIKYNPDNTFKALFIDNLLYEGKWELLDNSGKIRLTSPSRDFDETFDIIRLVKDTFEFADPLRFAFYRQVKK